MLIHAVEISQTASSGAWSFNTPKFDAGMLNQIVIKAATADTTFDVTITDDQGNVIFDTAERGLTPTGTLNEMVNIPFKGVYTIAVSDSSKDEAFTGRLMVLEEYM